MRFTFDQASGKVVSASSPGVLNPNDPAVIQKLHDLNPSGTSTLAYGVNPDGTPQAGTPQAPPSPGTPGTDPNFIPGDPSSYLGIYGLPPDVISKVSSIFSSTPDVNQATSVALAYIRGTPWYAKTYPGINEGIARGLFSNEAGYRGYLNQADQLYQQFYGHSISTDEFGSLVSQGVDIGTLGKKLSSGEDLANISQLPGAGLFTSGELNQISANNAGLGSQSGEYLAGLMDYARQVAPIYNKYGAPLTRAQLEQDYRNGVTPDVVGKQFQGTAYVNANRNDIQYVTGAFDNTGQLSDNELASLGNENAGIDTDLGQKVQRRLALAQQRLQGVFGGQLAQFASPAARPTVASGATPNTAA